MRSVFLILALFSVVITVCAPAPEMVRDVETLPQENIRYLDGGRPDSLLVPQTLQNRFNHRADSLFFLPWHWNRDRALFETLRGLFEAFKKNPGWGENLRKRDAAWIEALEGNADLGSFPNTGEPGITTANSDLRMLPTNKPVFRDYRLAGEGFPFDYLETSSIPANTPVRIIQTAKDKSWVWVRSCIAVGWLPARDVASVDSAFIRRWEAGNPVVIVQDDIPITSQTGLFLFHAPLGMVFPKTGEDSSSIRFLVAMPGVDRKAVIAEAVLPKTQAADKPLDLTPMNLARMADRLIREPYGWGGMYQNRDCSATIRDLFIPFGILLPRNGNHQAEEGFGAVDLGMLDPAEKEKTVIQKGIPFLTLLWFKGHIMLYIGHERGRALAFHNLWGIRTRTRSGEEGRYIVGEAVVTTLSPGKGLRRADPDGDLLRRIQKMVFVVPLDSVLRPATH